MISIKVVPRKCKFLKIWYQIRLICSLVNRELVQMDDQRLAAESGDLRPCTDQSPKPPISFIHEQRPQAYTRPKTTYSTDPKNLPNYARHDVVETRPDDALYYTVISSTTTTTQRPKTTQETESSIEEEPTPYVYPTNQDLSLEFEPLSAESDEWELSTLTPIVKLHEVNKESGLKSTKWPEQIHEITPEPTFRPVPTRLQTTRPSFLTSSDQLPDEAKTNQRPQITQTDRHPDSTEFDESSVKIDPNLQNSMSNQIQIARPMPQNTVSPPYPTKETNELPELTSTVSHVDDLDLDPYLRRLRPEEICRQRTCGEHGICEPVNMTHVTCSCKDYYTGPNCDICKFFW